MTAILYQLKSWQRPQRRFFSFNFILCLQIVSLTYITLKSAHFPHTNTQMSCLQWTQSTIYRLTIPNIYQPVGKWTKMLVHFWYWVSFFQQMNFRWVSVFYLRKMLRLTYIIIFDYYLNLKVSYFEASVPLEFKFCR